MTVLISGRCQCGNKIRGAKNYCTKCRKALEHRLGETSDDYTIRTASILGNEAAAERAQRRKAFWSTIWKDPHYVELEQAKERAFRARTRAEAYDRAKLPEADAAATVALRRLQDYEDRKLAEALR